MGKEKINELLESGWVPRNKVYYNRKLNLWFITLKLPKTDKIKHFYFKNKEDAEAAFKEAKELYEKVGIKHQLCQDALRFISILNELLKRNNISQAEFDIKFNPSLNEIYLDLGYALMTAIFLNAGYRSEYDVFRLELMALKEYKDLKQFILTYFPFYKSH